jgi:hypothetical protein
VAVAANNGGHVHRRAARVLLEVGDLGTRDRHQPTHRGLQPIDRDEPFRRGQLPHVGGAQPFDRGVQRVQRRVNRTHVRKTIEGDRQEFVSEI